MQKLLPVLFILISTMGAAQLPGNSVSFVGLNSHYVTVPMHPVALLIIQ